MRDVVRNVHERRIDAPRERLATALDALGGAQDVLWPSPEWVPMLLDRPLTVGAKGGHGSIRYGVSQHEPGRRVRFETRPGHGFDGWHEFTLTDAPTAGGAADRCVLRHELRIRPSAAMRPVVHAVIIPLHDAVLEDLLDNAELLGAGRIERPARWSGYVRLLRLMFMGERPRRAAIGGRLVETMRLRRDLADAWRVRLRPGMPTDPQAWADALFRDPPLWVGAALVARQALVPLAAIPRAERSVFDTVVRVDDELLLGSDDEHLDFRVGVRVDHEVTVTSVAEAHNRRGRAYLAVVRLAHPFVVRSMLARAFRTHALASRRGGALGAGHKAPGVVPEP